MCSIIGSSSKEKIIELCKLNSYRGEYSHSISLYNPKTYSMNVMQRKLGAVSFDDIAIPEGHYCIVHQQAPTTENKGIEFVHPAEITNCLLWHNGILKQETIKMLQNITGNNSSWDSLLLLAYVNINAIPENIDGSFSCLYYNSFDKNLYLFRNEIAPMFYDSDLNISSTKFANSEPISANKMILFWPPEKMIEPDEDSFTTLNNPYSM